jgi:selenocysteine lyase/cysteine desulfurase
MNYETFLQTYPGYANEKLDQLFATQLSVLTDHHYLDWTGAAIAPDFLHEKHNAVRENVFGNPHSGHMPSMRSSERVEEAREAVLDYFHAPAGMYDVIFTQNATSAIKLLHMYSFENGRLLLAHDNHNAVVGLREFAKAAKAPIGLVPFTEKFALDEERLFTELKAGATGNKLFAYPAKSNYSGILHPLEWVPLAQEHGWDVLLDAAAFVANDTLDLSKVQPQFVPISFYKMFGWPTGIGCLLVRHDALPKLEKKWFTGGTISLVSFADDFFDLEVGHTGFEDGTLNFIGIPAVAEGIRFRKELGSPKSRAVAVASFMHDQLSELQQGQYRVVVHSPRGSDTVSFNFTGPNGFITQKQFESFASDRKVYVRVGCFCNPGSSEFVNGDKASRVHQTLLRDFPDQNQVPGRIVQKYVDDIALGAIRASCGYAARYDDAVALVEASKAFLASLQ